MIGRPVPPALRGHFTRHGWPKRAYDREPAQRAAARYKQVAYQCAQCARWHLASSDRGRR